MTKVKKQSLYDKRVKINLCTYNKFNCNVIKPAHNIIVLKLCCYLPLVSDISNYN